MKADELHEQIQNRGFKDHPIKLQSPDGKTKAVLWHRQTPAGALGCNDVLLTVDLDGEAELFRWASGARPLDLILSGKAPPA